MRNWTRIVATTVSAAFLAVGAPAFASSVNGVAASADCDGSGKKATKDGDKDDKDET